MTGLVVLDVIIGVDGDVTDAKVVRSVPMLGRRRGRCREAVAFRADLFGRRPRAGHHDGDGQFQSEIETGPGSLS